MQQIVDIKATHHYKASLLTQVLPLVHMLLMIDQFCDAVFGLIIFLKAFVCKEIDLSVYTR